MGKLPTMRSDKSEILPYNFKNYFVFIGTERLSDHPNRCMFNHWHDDLEIVIPLQGHMIYNINGDLIRLEPGKGVFVNSNQIHYGFLRMIQTVCLSMRFGTPCFFAQQMKSKASM